MSPSNLLLNGNSADGLAVFLYLVGPDQVLSNVLFFVSGGSMGVELYLAQLVVDLIERKTARRCWTSYKRCKLRTYDALKDDIPQIDIDVSFKIMMKLRYRPTDWTLNSELINKQTNFRNQDPRSSLSTRS